MKVPVELRYSAQHEWVAVDGTSARVGITDFAQDALGDVVFVEGPAVGSSVFAGEPLGEIESTKTVQELYAPVSGEVTDVNAALTDAPETVNADPYGEGWLCVVGMSDVTELDALMDADAYAEHTADEGADD